MQEIYVVSFKRSFKTSSILSHIVTKDKNSTHYIYISTMYWLFNSTIFFLSLGHLTNEKLSEKKFCILFFEVIKIEFLAYFLFTRLRKVKSARSSVFWYKLFISYIFFYICLKPFSKCNLFLHFR